MKKKVWIIGTGLAVGSALMVSSAFANMGDARGYEAYKSAIKTTAAVDSATQHIVLSVRDNGSELLNVDSTIKETGIGSAASGTASIRTGAASAAVDFYQQADGLIVKSASSDTYNVMRDDSKQEGDEELNASRDPEISKALENVIDALVGNVKNNITLSEASGGRKTIDMTLAGSQIPTAANVIGSFIVKEALSGEHSQADQASTQPAAELLGLDLKQLDPHLPQLSDEVNIDQVKLHAAIDEHNYLTDQVIELTVSGKDADGRTHKLVVSADIGISGIDATVPDTVDLSGKKVNVVEDSENE